MNKIETHFCFVFLERKIEQHVTTARLHHHVTWQVRFMSHDFVNTAEYAVIYSIFW